MSNPPPVAVLRRVAVNTYIANGRGAGGAQAAWLAVRGILTHLRAPYWNERLAQNRRSCRTYRSPLGEALELSSGEFGRHSPKWPRTQCSLREADDVRVWIIEWFERAARGRGCKRSAP